MVRAQDTAIADIVELVEAARRRAARTVNATMTALYWTIGHHIVMEEQRGTRRADYGAELIEQLAARLTKRFGRGFGKANLWQMRAFFVAYPDILQTASGELRGRAQTGAQGLAKGDMGPKPGRGRELVAQCRS
jgi:hypothetical protein